MNRSFHVKWSKHFDDRPHRTVSFELPGFCFYFSLNFSFLRRANMSIKLVISSAFERTLIYRIVSYRIACRAVIEN